MGWVIWKSMMMLKQEYIFQPGHFCGVIALCVFFLLLAVPAWGNDYYVSNTGTNTNDGSLLSPFGTIDKLLNVIQPGDTGYIRGGTYDLDQVTRRSGTASNPITIKAYSNEVPVLQGAGQASDGGRFWLQHDHYIIEGLDFRQGNSGVRLSSGASSNIIRNCSAHGHYYTGFFLAGGASYNQLINCDAYDMYDSGSDGGNADGFVLSGQTSPPGPGNTLSGCRAWNNSDDGFDVWKAAHPVEMTDCLSYNNGNHSGDGNGFKLGINLNQNDQHVLKRCVAWNNRQNGFDYNDNTLTQTLYNCTAYNNNRNYKFSNIGGGPDSHDLQNCISVATTLPDILLQSIIDNKTNSWNFLDPNTNGLVESTFITTNDAIITGPRNADGTIPVNDFLRLKKGSIFIDHGADVGFPFNNTAPDLGAFEAPDIPAFPGAEGGGAFSIGGRGGVVYEVTNLNNSGAGSLRAAVEAAGARTVVFKVGGIITLTSSLVITNPCLTIASQTAPGDGILIRAATNMTDTLMVLENVHDITLRYLQVRPGGTNTEDCIGATVHAYNIIIDHCSLSWSGDENLDIWTGTNAGHHVTWSWNLIAEGLGSHSCGLLSGSDTNAETMRDISVHHNLFAHNYNRNPLLKVKTADIINNIVYGWDWWATGISGGITVDIIGNRYKNQPGLGDGRRDILWKPHYLEQETGPTGAPSIYLEGNVGTYNTDPDHTNAWNLMMEMTDKDHWGWPDDDGSPDETPVPIAYRRYARRSSGFPVTVDDVEVLEGLLLSTSGVGACRRLDENGYWVTNRGVVDSRIIQEYLNGTGSIPADVGQVGGFPTMTNGPAYADSDHDGMPNAWETAHGLAPDDPDDRNDFNLDPEYSNLEMFLNGENPDDMDRDGISDIWEIYWQTNTTAMNATSDWDGDTVLDVDEYLLGTAPTATSMPLIIAITASNTDRAVSFPTLLTSGPAYRGQSRRYALEDSVSLMPAHWHGITGYQQIDATGSNVVCPVSFDDASSYFRVRARLED